MDYLFLLSGVGMIFVSLFAVIYWKIKAQPKMQFFFWGALIWIIGVGCKFIWGFSFNQTIIGFLDSNLPSLLGNPLSWIYIGLLTGIFECGFILGSLYVIKKIRDINWQNSVAYGVGFGSIEALLLGLVSLLRVLAILFYTDQIPQDVLETIALPGSFWQIPVPIIERISALFIHLFSVVLIFFAYHTKQWKWFWLSFFYKTIVDSIAAYIHLVPGVSNLTMSNWWIIQAIFLILALIGLLGIIKLKNIWDKRLLLEIPEEQSI